MSRLFLSICTGGVLLAASAVSQAIAPPAKMTAEQEISTLVAQLGSSSYTTRTAAVRRLSNLGYFAKEHLEAASHNADAEVRHQLEYALNVLKVRYANLEEQQLKKRLKAFIDKAPGVTLSGWKCCREVIGDDSPARALFVQMYREEPLIWEAYETGGLEQAIGACQERYGSVERFYNRPLSLGSAATFLWLVGEESVPTRAKFSEPLMFLTYRVTSHLAQEPIVKIFEQGPEKEALRKLLSRWINSPESAATIVAEKQMKVNIALQYKLEEAARVVQDLVAPLKSSSPQEELIYCLYLFQKAAGVVDLTKVDVKEIEGAVERAEILPQHMFKPMGKDRFEGVQLGDYVLSVLINWSRQDIKNYGSKTAEAHGYDELPILVFENAQQREEALAKWRAWSKENLKK